MLLPKLVKSISWNAFTQINKKHELKCSYLMICLINSNEHNAVYFYVCFHSGILSRYSQTNTLKSLATLLLFFHLIQTEWTDSVKCFENQVYLELNNTLCAVFVARVLTHVWLCPQYELIKPHIQLSHWAKEKSFKGELKTLSLNITPQMVLCLAFIVILT